jgi:hypothetical protein
MIAPFQNRYRMAWPFAVPDTFLEIDTTEEFPKWNVAGDWRVPPGKVCDLLTAKEFTFSFEFNSAAFNAEFGEEFSEDEFGEPFPEDVAYSVVCESGTWKYYDTRTDLQTFNLDYKWDTQVKLFQRDTDPDEESEYFSAMGFSGFRYLRYLNFTEDIGYWSFDITMHAPIPTPAKDQDGKYVWAIVGSPLIINVEIEKVNNSGPYPIVRTFPMSDLGSSYLGINDRGGQGQGEGGCFPVASVSIATHFPA